MAKKDHARWLEQLIRITEKGMEARRAGLPKDPTPYKISGGGKGPQRERIRAWIEGWELADNQIGDR